MFPDLSVRFGLGTTAPFHWHPCSFPNPYNRHLTGQDKAKLLFVDNAKDVRYSGLAERESIRMSHTTQQGMPPIPNGDDPSNAQPSTQFATTLSRVEPIRFPHIPARTRHSPTVETQYNSETGQMFRGDAGHPPRRPPHLGFPDSPPISKEVPVNRPSDKIVDAAPRNRDAHEISTEQVSQIAEYLRRKRDELEGENAELAISTWQQHQALMLQRDSLRQNLMAIRRLNSFTEKMRCELIEVGHCLVDVFDGHEDLMRQFTSLCETYADIAAQAKIIRAV